MRRNRIAITVSLAFLLLFAGGVAAQDEVDAATEPELRQALRRHFENRLRAELALTDEQTSEVLPRLERLEQERRRFLGERRELGRELRRAYRGGAPDARLQELLDRMTEVEVRSQQQQRELQGEIDRSLTVRQRVQFRFFVAGFRQELNRRIGDVRRERRGHRPPGGRRP